jgi:hypothetical protein
MIPKQSLNPKRPDHVPLIYQAGQNVLVGVSRGLYTRASVAAPRAGHTNHTPWIADDSCACVTAGGPIGAGGSGGAAVIGEGDTGG